MANETRQLAAYIVSSTTIGDSALRQAQEAVLDWIACALAGSQDPRVRPIYDAIRPFAPDGPAWVAGFEHRTSPITAALLNGAASHVLELDDIERDAYIHPGVTAVSAAMAVADSVPTLTVDNFLRAVIMGYEVSVRVGRSVNPTHYELWHTTATAGVFGAAAAAAVALNLTEDQTVFALGNSGSVSGGLWQFNADGAMTKPYHAGMAAVHGVLAALSAREGLTGPHRILEGDQGFLRATSRDFEPAKLVEDLGRANAIESISRKRWASCRFTHAAIDACMELRADKWHVRDIERIDVETFAVALRVAGHTNPSTAQEAKFSITYCVALALATGDVGIWSFATVPDPTIRNLVGKVHVHHNPRFDTDFPQKMAAQVTITFLDGTQKRSTVEFPAGDPEHPIAEDTLYAKVRSMLVRIIPPGAIETAIQAVQIGTSGLYHDWISMMQQTPQSVAG